MANVVGGSIVWDLDIDDKAFSQKLGQAQNRAKEFASSADKTFSSMADNLGKRLENLSTRLDSVGNSFIKFGAIPTAVLGLAGKAAVQFEDSMADVRKTVGLTEEQTRGLGDELLNLSKNTRTSSAELVDIAKIAGQLGVTRNQILPFTEAVNQAAVALGDEFTGGAEEVTKELGVLVNQFKLAGKNGELIAEGVTKVGSAINSLGAAGQATGPYMTDFSRRVGGIAPIVGLSIDKVLGLAAGLQELGQAPEVAGTAIQSLLVTMGKDVQAFAKVAGVSGAQFSKLLRTDINEALLLVSKGVSNGSESVEDLAQKLDGLGIDGQRTVAVLANLGNNTDLIRQKQALANQELEKGTSLTDEYNIKNNTAAANLAKFYNRINAIGVSLGNTLLPAINRTLDRVIPFVDAFGRFATENPQLVTGILSVGAAFTTLGVGLKAVSVILSGFAPLLQAGLWLKNSAGIVTAIKGIGSAFAFLNIAIGPIGWILIGIAAAIALLAVAWKNNWGDIQGKTKAAIGFIIDALAPLIDAIKRLPNFFEGIKTAIVNFGTGVVSGFNSFIAVVTNFFTVSIPNAINAGIEFFASLPSRIGNFLVETGLKFVEFLGFVTGLIIFGVPKLIEMYINFWLTLPARTAEVFMMVFNAVSTWITSIGEYLANTVPVIVNNVITFFNNLPGQIWNVMLTVYNRVVQGFTATWSWLTTVVPQMITSVVTYFSTLPARVGAWVETMRARVVTGFQNTWGSIVAEVSTWPDRLYNWGVNIANAFVNGIKAAIGRIVDAFKDGLNKARSVVEGKSPPIAGPFKDIDIWGENVGTAWVDGVRRSISNLTLDNPFNVSAPAMATVPTSGGQVGGMNGPLVNVERMEVREDSDITDIARELGFRIELSPGYTQNG